MLKEPLFSQQVFTVSEVTGYIRLLLEENRDLQDIWIQGEISNLSQPSSGHIYFTLKDEEASLRCVIWKWVAQYLHFQLGDGLAVDAHGKFNVYEKGGQYQFYVDAVRLQGEGRLYQEFLRLKQKLEAEGLFDENRKKEIPPFPQRIGVVTSPTGAALQDILNTLRKRFPLAEVLLSPSLVQGDNAAENIIHALDILQHYPEVPDVIILARGGGSLEDLWSFNEESVVRAVAASSIPVISGVGHETDFTLVDFAADMRAPTPTGAAVLAVPDIQDQYINLQEAENFLRKLTDDEISTSRIAIKECTYRLQHLSPQRMIQQNMIRLDELSRQLKLTLRSSFELMKANYKEITGRFQALNPMAVLQRGYALIVDSQGKAVDSITKTKENEKIKAYLKDGTLTADVIAINKNETGK